MLNIFTYMLYFHWYAKYLKKKTLLKCMIFDVSM